MRVFLNGSNRFHPPSHPARTHHPGTPSARSGALRCGRQSLYSLLAPRCIEAILMTWKAYGVEQRYRTA
jgi:hypothetical protein